MAPPNPFTKAKAHAYADKFDREMADTFILDEYKAEFNIIASDIERATAKLTKSQNPSGEIPDEERIEELLEERHQLICGGNDLLDRMRKKLTEFGQLVTEKDQRSNDRRRQIKDALIEIFPAVQHSFQVIMDKQDGEIARMTNQIESLTKESLKLSNAAGAADGVKAVKDSLANILEKSKGDNAIANELKNKTEAVRRLEGELQTASAFAESAVREKNTLAARVGDLDTRISTLENEKTVAESEFDVQKKDLERQRDAQVSQVSAERLRADRAEGLLTEFRQSNQQVVDSLKQSMEDAKLQPGNEVTLKNQIFVLKKEVTASSCRRDQLQMRVDSLEEQLRISKGNVNREITANQNLRAELKSKLKESSDVTTELTNCRREAGNYKVTYHDLLTKYHELNGQKSCLQAEFDNAKAEWSQERETLMTTADAELSKHANAHEQATTALNGQIQTLQQENDRLIPLENDNMKRKLKETSLENKIKEFTVEKEQWTIKNKSLEDNLKTLKEEKELWTSDLMPELDRLREEASSWTNMLKPELDLLREEASSWTNTLKPELDHLREEASNWANNLIPELERLRQDGANWTSTVEPELQRLRGEDLKWTTTLLPELMLLREEKSKWTNELTPELELLRQEKAGWNDTINSELDALRAEKTAWIQRQKVLQAHSNELKDHYGQTMKDRKAKREDWRKIIATAKEQAAQITTQTSTISSQDEQIKGNTNTIKELNGKLAYQATLITTQTSTIRSQDEQIRDNTNTITELNGKIAGQDTLITTQTSTIKSQEEQIKGKINTIKRLKGEIADHSWDVALREEIQQELDKLQVDHSACSNKIEASEYDNLQQRFDELQTAHSACPKKINAGIHWGLERRFHEFKQAHADCDTKIDASVYDKLRRDLDELIATHKACDTKVEASVYSRLEEQFRNLRLQHDGCADVKTELTTAENAYEICAGTLQELQNKFDTLESNHKGCADIKTELTTARDAHESCAGTLQELQVKFDALHSECVKKIDPTAHQSLQEDLTRTSDAHKDCGSNLLQVQLEFQSFKNQHQGCSDNIPLDQHRAVQQELRTLQEQHNPCADTLRGIREKLSTFQAQHLSCVASATYRAFRDLHANCAEKVDYTEHQRVVNELADISRQHSKCPPPQTPGGLQRQSRTGMGIQTPVHRQVSPPGSGSQNLGVLGMGSRRQSIASSQGSEEGFQSPQLFAGNVERHLTTPVMGQSPQQIGTMGPHQHGMTTPGTGQPIQYFGIMGHQQHGTTSYGMNQSPQQSGTMRPQQQGMTTPGTGQPIQQFGTMEPQPGMASTGMRYSMQHFGTPAPQQFGSLNPLQQLERYNAVSQSPSPYGQINPPPPQPVGNLEFEFLVDGDLATGHRTKDVSQALIDRMISQIQKWEGQKRVTHIWSNVSSISHKRCVETRRKSLPYDTNPPAGENPNVACARCIKMRMLCVLTGKHGPVVVPLPGAARPAIVFPLGLEHYIKN